MATSSEILFAWFLTPSHDPAWLAERNGVWFGKNPQVDASLRERFGADMEAAARGELDDWASHARGRLALLLLLDQLPRNLHRGSPAAFATDPRAQALCLDGLERGQDQRLHPAERVFFYLPLEHAEDLGLQERSVELFAALAQEVPAEVRVSYETYLDYARRHRDVIARFGRFPHRNATLGRETTAEERAFLEQPGSSF